MSSVYKEDIELAKMIQKGDPEADEELYFRFKETIARRVKYQVWYSEDCEDVINDIWEAIFDSLRAGKYNGLSSLKTYIGGIIKNQIRNYISKKGKGERIVENPDSLDKFNNEEKNMQTTLEDKELREGLKFLIQNLKPKYKEVIYIRYFCKNNELTSYEEIARNLNISLDKVKNRLYMAHKMIREKIKGKDNSFNTFIFLVVL